jgi:hypothetical protein
MTTSQTQDLHTYSPNQIEKVATENTEITEEERPIIKG